MKRITCIILFSSIATFALAQSEKEQVEKACLNYIEGFYEGDTAKLIASLKPTLYKFGYWKNKDNGKYEPDGHMTWQQAIDYAKKVAEKKNFAKPGTQKKVELLDLGTSIAAAKVSAWWGIDYILLAKQDGKWMIEQVLWEGPPEK